MSRRWTPTSERTAQRIGYEKTRAGRRCTFSCSLRCDDGPNTGVCFPGLDAGPRVCDFHGGGVRVAVVTSCHWRAPMRGIAARWGTVLLFTIKFASWRNTGPGPAKKTRRTCTHVCGCLEARGSPRALVRLEQRGDRSRELAAAHLILVLTVKSRSSLPLEVQIRDFVASAHCSLSDLRMSCTDSICTKPG